ncbi:MAG TPA: type II toxin-antitoxin system VapC family toxin [Fimbriiglobus sp.]|nr:type II toxin-antitoxin system VapC family toxin [Fimbriiglobus sp.]
MILLDTHVWVWWVQADPKLTTPQQGHIAANGPAGLGVSVISCWEIALLDAAGKITLPVPVEDWVRTALAYPGVRLVDLSPEIAIASTRLPAPFHKDPADRILVATARVLDIPVLTADAKVLAYPHVRCLT